MTSPTNEIALHNLASKIRTEHDAVQRAVETATEHAIRCGKPARMIIAIKRASRMLDTGDVDGYAVWKRIVDAIKDTQRETPRPGEHRH